MAIVATDLVFLSSERMTDTLAAWPVGSGGYAALPVVQDGISNNILPDVMPTDRVTGRRQLRLIHPAVLSNENSRAHNMQVGIVTRPTNPNVEAFLFAAGAVSASPQVGLASLSAASVSQNYLLTPAYVLAPPAETYSRGSITALNPMQVYDPDVDAGTRAFPFQLGDKVLVRRYPAGSLHSEWRTVTALDSGAGTYTLSGPPASAFELVDVFKHPNGPFPISAAGLLSAALNSGTQNATVDRLEVRVLPTGSPQAAPGFVGPVDANVESLIRRDYKHPAFMAGGRVLLQHPSTPATREVAIVESVNYHTGVVRLTAGVTNTYPINSVITSLVDLGDVQAEVSLPPFVQQAWTRTWADAAVGPSITPRYSGVVGMNNAGSITERWAVVFSSPTQFNLIGERVGQVASGNIGSNFIPLNPSTSQPYMTLYATAWGSGWLPGNVLRFNTRGAQAGVWVSRCVSPGAASGSDAITVFIRADVDA